MNLSAYPSVRLCLTFAAGIFVQDSLFPQFDPTYLFYAALPLCAISSLLIHRKVETVWISGVVILATIFLAGMMNTWQKNELTGAHRHFSQQADVQVVSGVIATLPEKTANGFKFRLEIGQTIHQNEETRAATGNLQVYLKVDSATSVPLQYGDLVAIRCSPTRIQAALNPDAFDFADYMHTLNVHYNTFTRPDSIIVLAADRGSTFWKYAYAARTRVLGILATHFTDPAELGVAEALLVGYKGHLPDELTNAYIETGSMHVLAVSGAHVGIIFMGIVLLLKRIPIKHRHWRKIETCIILACIWGFAFLAGMGPSIARATVMFTFFLFARAFRLDYEGYNVLAASAFCLLVYEPLMLFQVSFQLSFLAVLGMMLFFPVLNKLSPVLPKWADYFWQIFLLGLAAQLGTLPLSLYYFGQFPVYFWLSGLIVVPIATIYMYTAAVLLLVGSMPTLAYWAAQPIVWMVKGMNASIYFIQKMPFALLDGIWLRWWEVGLLLVFVALLAWHVHRPSGKWLVYAAACICLLSASHFGKEWFRRNQNELTFYHTGSAKLLYGDFVSGHARQTLSKDSLSPKLEKFAAVGHRSAMGVKQTELGSLRFEENIAREIDWLATDGPFIQFGQRTLAVLNKEYQFEPNGQPIAVDGLVLDGSARVDLEVIFQIFQPETLVLGQSVSRRIQKECALICQERGILCHAIGAEGAWVLK
jgi:competence protein ComEC